MKALSLLKDLHIKVYDMVDKNGKPKNKVHFKDVLKALIQRILEEQRVDYKLSNHLDHKMNEAWAKNHKTLEKAKDKQLNTTVE